MKALLILVAVGIGAFGSENRGVPSQFGSGVNTLLGARGPGAGMSPVPTAVGTAAYAGNHRPSNYSNPSCQSYPIRGVCANSLCPGGKCRTVSYDPAMEAEIEVYFRALLGFKSTECRMALVDMTCGLVFPECKYLLSPAPAPAPTTTFSSPGNHLGSDTPSNATILLYPCSTMCTRLNDTCNASPALLPQGWHQIIDEISHNYKHSTWCDKTIDCVNTTGADGSVLCPAPLGQPDADGFDPIPEAPYCGMPCTSSVFNEDEYRVAETTLEVLSWASVFFTALHLVERISSGQASQYPNSMQLHFAFCLLALSSGLCINSFVGDGFGKHPNWCLSANQGLCTVQAVIVNYFATAVIFWWLAVCVHLYLAVVVYHGKHQSNVDSSPNLLPANNTAEQTPEEKIQRDTVQWQTHFKVMAYLIPGVITLLLLFCDELGAGGTAQIFCWIKDDNEQWWQFVFFYFELGLAFTAGAILFVRVIHYIWTRDAERSFSRARKMISSMHEGILYVLLFFVVFFWLLVYRIQVKADYDEYGDAYEDWVECTLRAWANSYNESVSHGVVFDCPNRDRPSYFMWVSEIVCVAGMGVLEFIVLDLHHCINRVRSYFCPPETPLEDSQQSLIDDIQASTESFNSRKMTAESFTPLALNETLAQSEDLLADGLQGHSDSPPRVGISNISTLTTDSASSTPCHSPQIRGQEPMRQANYRMSMYPKRNSMVYKHGPGFGSIHSKRELYALAMAPTPTDYQDQPSLSPAEGERDEDAEVPDVP